MHLFKTMRKRKAKRLEVYTAICRIIPDAIIDDMSQFDDTSPSVSIAKSMARRLSNEFKSLRRTFHEELDKLTWYEGLLYGSAIQKQLKVIDYYDLRLKTLIERFYGLHN